MALKGEIDKEEMFRKIMPSSYLNSIKKDAENTENAVLSNLDNSAPLLEEQPLGEQPTPVQEQQPMYQQPAPVQEQQPVYQQPAPMQEQQPVFQQPAPVQEQQPVYQQPAPMREQQPAYQQPASVQEQQPVYQQPASVQEQQPVNHPPVEEFQIAASIEPVNLAEILIERYYPRYLERLSGCPCQQCRDDVFGMALNQIKPRYIPKDLVNEDALNDRALITETVTQLLKALFVVKKNPKH